MQLKTSGDDFGEVRNIKLMIFEFFKQVNNYRTLGRGSSFFHIIISFLQLFFLIDKILVDNNLETKYVLTIYDFFKYATSFSLLVPILEMDGNGKTLSLIYSTILYITYIYLVAIIGSIIYVIYCIAKNKEVYFKIILNLLSWSFLHFNGNFT